MGNANSGRYRTHNRGAVSHTCRIDIRHLCRMGALKEGRLASGSLRWTRGDEETGSVGLVADLTNPERRRLNISYSYKGEPCTVEIRLNAVPMRYGGFRYYAWCPKTLRRCEVLPIVGGVIACRQFHRLTYRSQSLDRISQLQARADRFEAQLTQKHRRGRTRERLVDAWHSASKAYETLFCSVVRRRWGDLL